MAQIARNGEGCPHFMRVGVRIVATGAKSQKRKLAYGIEEGHAESKAARGLT